MPRQSVIGRASPPTLAALRQRREALVRRAVDADPRRPHPHAFCRRCGRVMLAPTFRRQCETCGDELPPPVPMARLNQPPSGAGLLFGFTLLMLAMLLVMILLHGLHG